MFNRVKLLVISTALAAPFLLAEAAGAMPRARV
jgi:hypothetical protein